MPIGGFKIKRYKTYVRIKADHATQKQYNRFKNDLRIKYHATAYGKCGYTEILGDCLDVNVIKSRDGYIHVIILGTKEIREDVLELMKLRFGICDIPKKYTS